MGSTPGASKTFQPRQSGLSSITVTLFAFAFIGRDFAHHQPCVYLKYGGQSRQTASKRPRTVVRGYELRIVSPLSRGGAEPFELQPRRDSCPFFQATRNARRNRDRKARHGCLPHASDWKRRLKIMLGVPSSRWLHGFQMIRSWLHPLAHSEKLGFSCGCLLK
jgi:hypothetical protein